MVFADDLVALGITGEELPFVTVVSEQRFLFLLREIGDVDLAFHPQHTVGGEGTHLCVGVHVPQEIVGIAKISAEDTLGGGVGVREQIFVVDVRLAVPILRVRDPQAAIEDTL